MLDPKKELEQWGPLDGNVLFASFWYKPMCGAIKKKWGIDWTDMVITVAKGRTMTAWWDKRGLEKSGIEAIKKYLFKPKKLKVLLGNYEHIRDKLMALNQEILNTPIRELRGDTGKKWYETASIFWRDATVFEMFNYGAAPYLRSKIEKIVPAKDIERVLTILLAPEKMSFHKRSEVELYRVIAKKGSFEKYAQKWFWVDNSYLESRHITAKEFAARVKGLTTAQARKKIADAKKYFADVVAAKKRIAKKYKLSKDILKAAHALSWSVWVQDERKGAYWHAIAGIEKMCRFASLKYKVPFKDLLAYPAEQWAKLISTGKNMSAKELKAFKARSLAETGFNRYRIHSGARADRIAERFLKRSRYAGADSLGIKGLAVSFGKAQGKVKILLSPRKLNNFKHGEILVAPFTSPDYVLAMRRSKAIVTDIGGITSHAAVISRELNIPCIVGTGNATKVLKDGDVVEVDANNGIVRVLKK